MQLQGSSLVCVVELNLYYSISGEPRITVVENGVENDISEDEAKEIIGKYHLQFSEYKFEEFGYYYVEGNNAFDYDCSWPSSGMHITAGRGDATVWYLEEYINNY